MTESNLTVQDLYQIQTLSDPRFSPDGQWLAYVQTCMDKESNGYKSAIWLAPSGGEGRRQFTNGDKRDATPRWSPNGRWLAFVSNRGDEKAKAQIYTIATDGGEARRLTEMENGAGEPAWSPDGKFLAFTSRLNAEELAAEGEPEPDTPPDPDEVKRLAEEKKRREKEKADPRVVNRFAYRAGTSYYDDRTLHLYVLEVDPETGQARGKPRRLTEDTRNYSSPRWMPGGDALLATVDRDPGVDDLFYFSDIIRVPVDGSEPVILSGPETGDGDPWPSPDGRWIAYHSQLIDAPTTANVEIALVPSDGGEPRILTGELDAHAENLRWAPDGQSLTFLAGAQGRIDLCSVAVDGGRVTKLLTADREILAYDLSADGQQVGFVASTDRAPSDLYLAALGGDGAPGPEAERRLTEINNDWLAERTLGDVEDLWYESTDGTAIQGWIIKPPDWDPAVNYPLVLSIHGGPHVMWSRHEATMWHEWHVMAASGYVVFACNPRGSSGYGRDFREAALHRWGEADLDDLLTGVEQVVAKGLADPERLVITGGSYGGFMTAWVIAHDDRFKAAVAQRGVYDLSSFYSTSDVPLLTEWDFGAAPWEDPEKLWRYSPLAHVEKIHTPLLLIHSENDYRAPIPAAEGLFVALRRLKREVEMVRYPRDGHELSRGGEPKHRVDRLERIVGWFDKYVKASAAAERSSKAKV